jgi:hypothetical protein
MLSMGRMWGILLAVAVVGPCEILHAPVLNHGLGLLQRIRNESAYPISYFLVKTIHDQLPEGSVVRIKSLRPEYGAKGRYYAVRRIKGAWRLVADTTDPDDPATLLDVGRFISGTLTDYLGFSSNLAGGKYMTSLPETRAVQFSGEQIFDDEFAETHWKIFGKTLDRCYLKGRISGYLSARGSGTSVLSESRKSGSVSEVDQRAPGNRVLKEKTQVVK